MNDWNKDALLCEFKEILEANNLDNESYMDSIGPTLFSDEIGNYIISGIFRHYTAMELLSPCRIRVIYYLSRKNCSSGVDLDVGNVESLLSWVCLAASKFPNSIETFEMLGIVIDSFPAEYVDPAIEGALTAARDSNCLEELRAALKE
mgnify:CR=1 FL=1